MLRNSPYRDELLDRVPIPPGNPVPSRPGDPSPIQHVIYIVKENRTYDQVLGDSEKGNGDPSLMLFGENVTPNHHKLAREFVLFDNFYVNADVSADGHNWSTRRSRPTTCRRCGRTATARRRRHYDYEGGEPAAHSARRLYLDKRRRGGRLDAQLRLVGEQLPAAAPTVAPQIASVRDPVLAKVTNMQLPRLRHGLSGRRTRAKVFLQDLARVREDRRRCRGCMLVRIGNDHTSGTAAGKIAPLSAVADNDYALGMIVEACRRAGSGRQTAIFVLEDDAQNGPDHVDSHRSPAFVISPYTRRGHRRQHDVQHHFDAAHDGADSRPASDDALRRRGARPMSAAFAAKPDLRPYTAEKPRIPLDERNPAQSATAAPLGAAGFQPKPIGSTTTR